MTALSIEAWIKCLGQTYDAILEKHLIPEEDFIELFPNIDELYLEPQEGISMTFWAETERFEALHITLIKTTPSTVEYRGDPPPPYTLRMRRSDIHERLGKPLEYSGPIRMPEPMGLTGGWEDYQLDSKAFPNIRLTVHYLESMDVSAISFALVDKGHD